MCIFKWLFKFIFLSILSSSQVSASSSNKSVEKTLHTKDKESSQTAPQAENAIEYSLLEIYNSSKVNDTYFHVRAQKNCDLQIKENKQYLNFKIQKNPCMENRILFKYDELQFRRCDWNNEVPESPVKSLGIEIDHLKEKILLRNVEVYIDDQSVKCRADLVLTNAKQNLKIAGPCAPAEVKYSQLSHYKSKPLVSYLEPVDKNNILQKSMDKILKLKTDQVGLVLVAAIPLPPSTSNYIQYLLSSQAERDCNMKISK